MLIIVRWLLGRHETFMEKSSLFVFDVEQIANSPCLSLSRCHVVYSLKRKVAEGTPWWSMFNQDSVLLLLFLLQLNSSRCSVSMIIVCSSWGEAFLYGDPACKHYVTKLVRKMNGMESIQACTWPNFGNCTGDYKDQILIIALSIKFINTFISVRLYTSTRAYPYDLWLMWK